MKYGLTEDVIKSIVQVFRNSANVEKALLFGSRAKGNYRPGSDIDIALFGAGISFDEFLNLKLQLDDLGLLNKIDLVKFESIENPDFIDHINRVGICIYDKTKAE